ncbi:H(+)/Cl(-) exchange transporter 7 [Homalodisca vitripennis]|nr:H(+)/Cl(-) exchange transporter 7 [Homalodisca vitripennis]
MNRAPTQIDIHASMVWRPRQSVLSSPSSFFYVSEKYESSDGHYAEGLEGLSAALLMFKVSEDSNGFFLQDKHLVEVSDRGSAPYSNPIPHMARSFFLQYVSALQRELQAVSLNYIKILNKLEVEHEKTLTFHSLMMEDCVRICYFILAGILTGLVGVFVEGGILVVGRAKYSFLSQYISEHFRGDLPEFTVMAVVWSLFTIVPIMIGSALVVFIAPYAAGGGVAQCVAYMNGVRVPKVLSIKGLWVKSLSTICCVTSGLAGGKMIVGMRVALLVYKPKHEGWPSPCWNENSGKIIGLAQVNEYDPTMRKSEGPMMHLGAIAGGSLPSALPWPSFKSDHERRDLAAAGFGAGIAVAFGAPIGTVI